MRNILLGKIHLKVSFKEKYFQYKKVVYFCKKSKINFTMLKIYQVDAFTDRVFSGNPAAVCPLEKWLPDEVMQNIAAENNLAETAFFVPSEDGFDLRWFTPTVEVDLCGHATLATAHIIFTEMNHDTNAILFNTKSGILTVTKIEVGYKMDFPADMPKPLEGNKIISDSLGVPIDSVLKGKDDYIAVLSNQKALENLQPDFALMATLKSRGLIVTAPGDSVDFVSRCFYPQSGVDEDPVTGSAHTAMTPYWSIRLGKDTLTAQQISARGGKLVCALEGDRVFLYGRAVTFLRGEVLAR